jgi:phosphatidylinositol-3-phosphatase
MKPHHFVGGLSVILLISAVLGAPTLSVPSVGNVIASSGRWFDYVVVIMLENHSINATYGISVPPNSWNSMSKTCLGNCMNSTAIANANGLAKFYRNSGVSGGSVGDYIAITSGYGNTSSSCNNGPTSSGCSLQISNIVDSLENARLSWKAYMEGYPIASGCFNGFTGSPNHYAPNHNPFIYYADIQNNVTRCAHIVNANSQVITQSSNGCWPSAVENDDLFLGDLNSVSTASKYMFLTPNTVDDEHDCNDVSTGDAYLGRLIPQILGSFLFRTQRAALFITFDEPDCTNPLSQPVCPSESPELYSVWASSSSNPITRAGLVSNRPYTHFSQLKTVEDNWGLPPLVSSTDGNAPDMQEFFL